MVKIRVFDRNSEKMARIGHLVGYGSKWAVFFFYLTPEIDLSNNFGIGKCFRCIGCVFLSDILLKHNVLSHSERNILKLGFEVGAT